MPDEIVRTAGEIADYFTQPIDAIELVRVEPSDAAIQARLDAGETLADIAASIAIAQLAAEGDTGGSE